MDSSKIISIFTRKNGIKLSSKQISRILQKKYVYIWAKSSLESKQDATEIAGFRKKLATYLKAGEIVPEVFQVWFWDETGFSLRVIRRKCWTRRGHRKKVSGKRSRGRVNVMGGLRYHDRKRLCFFVDEGNADSFFEQLVKLNEFVTQE